MSDEKSRKNKSKKILIVLSIMVLLGLALIGLLVLNKNEDFDIKELLSKETEETMLLDEFIINLKFDGGVKNYLKIQMALMYMDVKEEKFIETNKNKIRDVIINQLRNKTSEEILDTDKTEEFKKEIINHINKSLKENIIQDIYFTNLVIQ